MFSPFINAAWYFKENKICDPVQSNILPFSGFRINRKYKLLGLGVPVSMNFLTIAHCDHGKVDYDKTIRLKTSVDIDWDTPFCMLKPQLGKPLSRLKDDTIRKLANLSNENSESSSGVVNTIKKKLDYFLEKHTEGGKIEYSGKARFNHNQDMKSTNPQSSAEWESRNLVCYKMARRPKYAKRDLLFYVPDTFVGGLFECPIPSDRKTEIFRNMTSTDIVKPFNFKCDPSVAKPLLPLIAADSTSRWFEYDVFRNPFNPSIIQTIPYLTTVTPFNVRFSAMESSDMYKDSWASKIDVNENYSYNEVDLNLMSKAFALSADYLNKLYSPPEIPKILSQFNIGVEKMGVKLFKLLLLDFKNMNAQDKIGLILSYKNKRYVRAHLKALQKIWDDMIIE